MSKRNILLIGLLLSLSFSLLAQDTLKIMQYNLLYYGKNVYDCNSTNNNIDNKNTQLQTILSYVQPDIFCVNEMDASLTDVNYLMDNALNVGGETHWQHANVSGSYSINMLYYNSDKFNLNSQESIYANPRQIDVYHLTYTPESINFTIFVAHLKAGSYAEDQTKKADATENVMNYIASRGAGNYLFMGDLNLYTSSEQAFQNLINPTNSSIAFYDPVNRIGSWNNNSSYSDVHTQSTHSSSDCFAGGGMDDRFDFIMISEDIKDGNQEVSYLSNSYETIGQDGNHYNDALIDGANNSAPSNVITALYNMSDHLPVSLELVFGTSSAPETVFNKTFDDQDLTSGGWAQFSVLDNERFWSMSDNTYGHNGTYYAKMSGWDYTNSAAIDNEDWLISPAFNADELLSEVLTFWSASKYTGNDLQLYYSTDYLGTGNPNLANWVEITGFNWSNTSEYQWESSGNIDLSQAVGENVRIAFKFTSTESSGSKTWQLDDILLKGISVDASISKKDLGNIGSIEVFPNPSKGEINLSYIIRSTSDINLQIFNVCGKMIYNKVENSQIKGKQSLKIELSEKLPSGLYFVKVSDGRDFQTIKLLIE